MLYKNVKKQDLIMIFYILVHFHLRIQTLIFDNVVHDLQI